MTKNQDGRDYRLQLILLSLCLCGFAAVNLRAQDPLKAEAERAMKALEESPSRLSDEAIGLQIDSIPERPSPLLELGDPFLDTGPIGKGFQIPGGAFWNPSLQVYGTFRTALQVYDTGDHAEIEWANRLDLYANLALTATERILVGVRPFDDEGRQFLGYGFESARNRDEGWRDEFDARISTLFFEGDFGELFPNLDPDDSGILDFGFAVGRQALRLQDGILLDDTLDGLGVIRNTLKPLGLSNLRLTAFYAWNHVNRGNRQRDDSADLFGLFSEADLDFSTLALDLVYVSGDRGDDDGFYAAASAVQRVAFFNLTLRAAASFALEDESAAIQDGYLLFAELSLTPTGTEDLLYMNIYWGLDDFSSAARAEDAGGPLARIGILYAAQGLGQFGSALSSDPQESFGLSLGWQFVFDENRKQVIVEWGLQSDTDGRDHAATAIGARYQQAIGENFILQVDAFGVIREQNGPGYGFRCEFLIKF